MKQESFKINLYNYNVYFWGDKKNPPLYFLHGWMDSGANFHYVAEVLKEKFFVIAPDLRGHGRTDNIKDPLGNRFYDYVADFYELHQLFHSGQPIDLVGHSMGGNIGLLYSGTFPELVNNFVNIEGLGIPNNRFDEGPDKMRRWIEQERNPELIKYPSVDLLRKNLQKKSPYMTDEVLNWVVQHLGETSGSDRSYTLRADPKLRHVHPHIYQWEIIQPFLQKIKASFYFIYGEETFQRQKDSLPLSFKEQWDKRIQELPEQSIIKTIPLCGHMVHYEKPIQLAEIINEFLGVKNA